MSGGHFDYQHHRLNDIIAELKHLIDINDSKELNEYGERIGYGFSEETINVFKDTVNLATKVYNNIHAIDYLICGDIGEETLHERINKGDKNELDI